MSDRTWGRLGRRRPYFLTGAILASLALAIITNSPTWIFATVMLWIMDASINISMEPFRAFVGDMLSSEQRTSGFAMQSFFIGIGAGFSYLAGTIKHAPGWMKYMALEWFYRLLQEPNRLWRRYVKNNTLFILYTLRELLTGTLPGGRSA